MTTHQQKFESSFYRAVENFRVSPSQCSSRAEECVRRAGLPAQQRHKIVWAVMLAGAYAHSDVDHHALAEQAYENAYTRLTRSLIRLIEWHASLADHPESELPTQEVDIKVKIK